MAAIPSRHWVTLSRHVVQIPGTLCAALKKAHPDVLATPQDCQATTGILLDLPLGQTAIPSVIGGGGGGSCGSISVPWKQYNSLSSPLGGYYVEHSGMFTYTGCSASDSGHVCSRNMTFNRPAYWGVSNTGCRDNNNGSSKVDAEADYLLTIPTGGYTLRLDATCDEMGNISDPSVNAD